ELSAGWCVSGSIDECTDGLFRHKRGVSFMPAQQSQTATIDRANPPDKKPFDIDRAMDRIRTAVQPFPKAALFELYEDGFTSAFEQLTACIISIRTLDEVMIVTARKLFAVATTPGQVAALTLNELDDLIHDSAFHGAK